MNPEEHSQVYTMQDRLDLIAKRIQFSTVYPQKNHLNQEYMLFDFVNREVIGGAPEHGIESERAIVGDVFHWVKRNVRYSQEDPYYDVYRSAGRTISARAGDCDCHTILVSSMLRSVGFLTGARVVSPDDANWHIYAIVGVYPFYAPTRVIPLDTTQAESFPGWEPSREQRRYMYQVDFELDQAKRLRKVSG